MKRVAIFIDAGYFFVQSSVALTGVRQLRGSGILEIRKLTDFLTQFAVSLTKAELLRIYWYDGTDTGPSPQHLALAIEPNIKLRLGFVNAAGQQKGVDSLIVTDMINLARNGAMTDAVLMSGDEDLRIGVQQAQEFGVRVHLVGICSHPHSTQKHSQSLFLLQEADTTHVLTPKELSKFIAYKITSSPAIPESTKAISPLKIKDDIDGTTADIAKQYALEIDVQLIEGLIGNYDSLKQIPPEIDRPLFGRIKRLISGAILTQDQKSQIRKTFIESLSLRLPKPKTDKK